MYISEIELFEILSQQLGAEKAKTLVKYVEAKVDKRLEEKTDLFASKEDIAKVETKIAETKVDIIKWVFAMFFALMLAVVGLYFKS